MKIIFLDIDWVLNSFDNMRAMHCVAKKPEDHDLHRDEYGDFFDPRCVNWLKSILIETEAELVISSSWRMIGLEKIRLLWSTRNLPGKIVGITGKDWDKIRWEEIDDYIKDNNIENYIIIDDDSDMMPHQLDRFIHTKWDWGLTYNDYKRSVEILNN